MNGYSKSANQSFFTLAIFAIFLLPSFFYVTLELTSLSAPLALISLGLLAIFALRKRLAFPKSDVKSASFFTAFLLLSFGMHLAIDVVKQPTFEAIATFATLVIFVMTAYLAVPQILKMRPSAMLSSVLFLQIAVTGLLILSIFIKPSAWNYDSLTAAVFPFAEPSHFAVFTAPLFLMGACLVKRALTICIGLTLLFASAILPNLTIGLLALTVLSMVLLRGVRSNLLIIGLVLGLLTLPSLTEVSLSLLPEYHQARVGLSDENLTSLVYLQGLERAYISIFSTFGYGAGFMRLAEAPSGFYGDQIFQISGSTKNLSDGGFVFAKLVGEFGVLGLVLSAGFAWYAIKAFVYILRNSARFSDTNWSTNRMVEEVHFFYRFISSILIFSYTFEFFVRGVGYISSGTLLLFIGIFIQIWVARAELSSRSKGRIFHLTQPGSHRMSRVPKATTFLGRGS